MTRSTKLLAALIAITCLGAGTSALAEEGSVDRDARRAQLLERFDTDGDGVISDAERSAARDELRSKRDELLQQYDKDGDGRLSPEEREAAGLPQGPGGWRRSR